MAPIGFAPAVLLLFVAHVNGVRLPRIGGPRTCVASSVLPRISARRLDLVRCCEAESPDDAKAPRRSFVLPRIAALSPPSLSEHGGEVTLTGSAFPRLGASRGLVFVRFGLLEPVEATWVEYVGMHTAMGREKRRLFDRFDGSSGAPFRAELWRQLRAFDLVGVVERFDETLLLLAQLSGLQQLLYRRPVAPQGQGAPRGQQEDGGKAATAIQGRRLEAAGGGGVERKKSIQLEAVC